jgi:hypothetical protein
VKSRSLAIVTLGISVLGCDRVLGKNAEPEQEVAPPPVVAPEGPVPPVQNGTPVEVFADAAFDPEGKTPFEQAVAYEASGQLWVARLLIEKKALSAEGTKQEAELLAKICDAQEDEDCLGQASDKLGRKLKLSGGSTVEPGAGPSPVEPARPSDLEWASDLFRKRKLTAARKLLEPKVLAPSPDPAEIALLKQVCEVQKDRVCVALCDAKMK